MRAYVFIDARVGMVAKVATRLSSLKSASARLLAVDTVTGPHDIIAILDGVDADSIGHVVSEEIHKIEGISKTTSCLVVGGGASGRLRQV